MRSVVNMKSTVMKISIHNRQQVMSDESSCTICVGGRDDDDDDDSEGILFRIRAIGYSSECVEGRRESLWLHPRSKAESSHSDPSSSSLFDCTGHDPRRPEAHQSVRECQHRHLQHASDQAANIGAGLPSQGRPHAG